MKPDNIMLSFEPKVMDRLIASHLKHRPVKKHPMTTVLGVSEESIVSESLPMPAILDINPMDWHVKLADFGCGA